MFDFNLKTKLKWIFVFIVAFFIAITGFILSVSTKSASASCDLYTEFNYAENNYLAGYSYNIDFSTNINDSSAVLSKTYYIEIAETTYNQLDDYVNHLVVCWGRKSEMDILAYGSKSDSVMGDPSFSCNWNSFYNAGIFTNDVCGKDVRFNTGLIDCSSYALFPFVAYQVSKIDCLDYREQGLGVGYGAAGIYVPITITWSEGNLFDIGILVSYQYSTYVLWGSFDNRVLSYYTDSSVVSTVESRVRNASSYSYDVAGAYEKALGIYRGGTTDIVFSYLKPVQGHFNTAEQAQGSISVPSVYVPDENYVKSQILQSNYANGRGLSGFNVEYNPTTAYSMTNNNVGHLDLLSPHIIRQATGISYGYSFGSAIPSTVNCPVTYADFTYSNFYVKIENSKNPNEYVDGYFDNDLQIDVYYTSYEEKNGKMYLYYDYDQIITLIGNTLHWSVQRDYFDLTVSGSYNSSLVTVGDYIVNGETRGKYVSFPYSTSSERQSQNCLFGLEITGTAPITVPVELDWTIVYQVLNNDLTTSTATLSVGQYYDNEFGRLENEILDRNGTWANYIYGSLQPAILGGIEFMYPIDLITGIGYINYDTLTATAFVEYAYNSAVLVIDNNLNSDKWIVQFSDNVAETSLLNLGVKSKIPAGYRVGSITEMDSGLRISNNNAGNPLNTTFYRVDSMRTEPYSMTVYLTDVWPVTINYLEQWKTSTFAIMNEFSGGLRVADYPSDENGNLVLSAADISEILNKDIVTMQFLKKSVCIDTVTVSYDSENDKYVVDLSYSFLSMKITDSDGNANEIRIGLTPFSFWQEYFGQDWSISYLAPDVFEYSNEVDADKLYGFFGVCVFKEQLKDFNSWFKKTTGDGCTDVFSTRKVQGSWFYQIARTIPDFTSNIGRAVGSFFGMDALGSGIGTFVGNPLYAMIAEYINDDNGEYFTYFFYINGTSELPYKTHNGADNYYDHNPASYNAVEDAGNSIKDFFADIWDSLSSFMTFIKVLLVILIVVLVGIPIVKFVSWVFPKDKRKNKK